MKKIRKLCMAMAMILATFAFAFAWIKIQVSVTNLSAELVTGDSHLQIAKTSSGTLASTLNADTDFELGCCTSTNGYEFKDENGNDSTEYGEYTCFIKADKKRSASAKVVCENADPSMRVAITYVVNNNTIVLTPSAFNVSQSMGVNFNTLGGEVTVRVWFDGATATQAVAATPFQVVFEAGETEL